MDDSQCQMGIDMIAEYGYDKIVRMLLLRRVNEIILILTMNRMIQRLCSLSGLEDTHKGIFIVP